MEGNRGGSPWPRLPAPALMPMLLLVVLASVAAVGEAKVVHVGEAHRRSMLANGLGSTPPMGYSLAPLNFIENPFVFF